MDESPSPPSRLIFVPNVLRRQGWGHFHRCRDAARNSGGYLYLAYDFLPLEQLFPREDLVAQALGVNLVFSLTAIQAPDRVVLDFQKTPPPLLKAFMSRELLLLGWDEGGWGRKRLPFLVDSLPNTATTGPNEVRESLLGIGQVRGFLTEPQGDFSRVLVVFGGGDPRNLTFKTLKMMKTKGFLDQPGRQVTVVRGPSVRWNFVSQDFPIRVLAAPQRLKDQLSGYDLVVCSWGLTALEALGQGVPVVLLNPENYHHRLCKKEGLPTFGTRKPSWGRFQKALVQAFSLSQKRAAKLPSLDQITDPGAFFSSFTASSGKCPCCSAISTHILYRLPHKTYFRCPSCRMEFLQTFNLPPKTYSQAYFFEDYQRQYGKTYLDDFSSIKALGHARWSFAQKCGWNSGGVVVLDIGCAYGPFLQAVKEAGGNPVGLDISPGAVTYVRENLGLPAVAASFPDFDWNTAFPGIGRPDVITLWYVIEHFEDLAPVLQKINELLPLGGGLLFSTPHGRGISRLFRPALFWTQSPDDHFSLWNRSNTRRVLGRFGFKVKAFRMAGRHPERFPGVKNKKSLLYNMVAFLDRLWGWADTFEVYAEKIKERP